MVPFGILEKPSFAFHFVLFCLVIQQSEPYSLTTDTSFACMPRKGGRHNGVDPVAFFCRKWDILSQKCGIMGNSCTMPWKTSLADPDSAWKRQNREQKQNQLYRYVNINKGGELVDVYENEGTEALKKYIEKYIEPLLYRNGKGKKVTKLHFQRWRNRMDAKLNDRPFELEDMKTDEQVLSEFREPHFMKFEDHETCWDLDRRGAMGETALHLLVLQDTPMHTDIAKILLALYPKLALDFYEAEEYYGESALHIAIVYGDFEMVKILVENGANVNQRATGRFFLPEDQKKGHTKVTTYEGYAYYGELPLAFASCFGHEEIYDYLIDHGADPNMEDMFGNTVLHMMVISNQITMFGYAVKHHAIRAEMEAQNHQGLTPLTLASKLGRNDIFKEIIELQSVEIWRYSNVTCAMYPLAPLDTIGIGGKTNYSSALLYITAGESDAHLEILDGGVIKQLLEEKWKTFARRRFFERFAVGLLHLIMLSIAIYLRPDANLLGPTDTNALVRYIAEIIVSADCLINTVFQCEELRSQGIMSYLKNQASAPAKSIFNVSCLLILICVPLRLLRLEGVEMIFLAFAAPCAWAFLLFFARGFLLSGPFVVIIYQMCTGDLVRFGLIYCIFMCGFVPAFYFLFNDIEDDNIGSFKSPQGTVMQLFQMTLGEFKYEDFAQTRIPILTKAVFALFAILVPILLLNMLIAMMGNTYQQVISRSEKEWKRQWAKIIIVLEQSYSRKQLLKFQEEYSVKLIGGANDDARGLMVIKTSTKTKARQRKGAISNWKRLVNEIKVLIKDQKKQGKSGKLDLTSTDVTASLSKKKSFLNTRSKDLINEQYDDDEGADGLINAMAQLAWEKDIDLTKGKAFQASDIREEEDSGSLSPGEQSLLLKDRRSMSPPGMTHPGVNTNSNASKDNRKNAEQVKESGTRSSAPKGRGTKVAPSPESSAPNSAGSGGKQVGVKKSTDPRNGLTDPDTPGSGKEDTKPKGKNNKAGKPPHGKPATASGSSKDSKDSGFGDGKPRKPVFTISGSRGSLTSASSLTSLLNAYDGQQGQQGQRKGSDSTEF